MQPEVDIWKPSPGMGKRIRLARQALDLTQETVAASIGVGKAAVARWEGETRIPGGEHLLPLAKTLQVPVDWLVAGHGLPPESPERAQAREFREQSLRLTQALMAAESLEVVAEKSNLPRFLLQHAMEGNCQLTIDEVVRVAQVLGISVSWLFFGQHGVRFAAPPESGPYHPESNRALFSEHPEYLRNRASDDRYERLRFLIKTQPSLKGLAKRSGVPEADLHSFIEEEEPLGLEVISKVVPACKSTLEWVLLGDSASIAERMGMAFGDVVQTLRDISHQGFDIWWRERQKQGWASGVLSYLKLKPLLEMYPDKRDLLELNAIELEAELAHRLNPPPLQNLGKLDWESIAPTYALLALAGWDHLKNPLPAEPFRASYGHILDRSLSGLPPDEAFVREISSQLGRMHDGGA